MPASKRAAFEELGKALSAERVSLADKTEWSTIQKPSSLLSLKSNEAL